MAIQKAFGIFFGFGLNPVKRLTHEVSPKPIILSVLHPITSPGVIPAAHICFSGMNNFLNDFHNIAFVNLALTQKPCQHGMNVKHGP